MADAEVIRCANQREPEESRIALDAAQQLSIRHLQIFESRIGIGLALAIEEGRKPKTVDEPFDLTGRHGPLLQIHHVNGDPSFLEESFGGSG
jgi:hypothetical protein